MSDVTKSFLKDPVAFMRKRSVCPPDDVQGRKGSVKKTLDTTGFTHTSNNPSVHSTNIAYRNVKTQDKIAYIQMYKDKDRAGIMRQTQKFFQQDDGTWQEGPEIEIVRGEDNREGIDVIRFRSDFASHAEWAPVYFLPWDAYGGIVKLVIPPKGTLNPDPDIFFTAAINGCSIFVQGTPSNPTVYHAGGTTGVSDHNDAARFWRNALQKHVNTSATAQGRGQITSEVNKMHYVKSPGTVGNSSTPRAEEYHQHLKQKLDKTGRFTVETVSPWGCFMGVRTGPNWSFYLQENATVICHIVTKTGVQTRQYARPICLTKVFPGGGSSISMKMKVPVKVT